MSRYISSFIREEVRRRADSRCEYCRIHDKFSFLAFHIDHIISIKHGGETVLENLAYSCPICNANKGTDIATYIGKPSRLTRLFNPRSDEWDQHFQIELTGEIIAITRVGRGTIKILDLNHPDSIIERLVLIRKGLF